MHYRYDGSLAGLLCVLWRVFSWRETPLSIASTDQDTQQGLFDEQVDIATESKIAGQLLAAMRTHLGPSAQLQVRDAFLSEAPEVEMAIYRYLAHGWRVRRRLDDELARPEVAAMHHLTRRVRREAHRFIGLTRFRETSDGLLYAPIEPDHFILPLLARHFSLRLAGERWLIHDVRRQRALLHEQGQSLLAQLSLEQAPTPSAEEQRWQRLWRAFHHHIAIAQRTNPRLQRSFMPMKYWKYLVELNEE